MLVCSVKVDGASGVRCVCVGSHRAHSGETEPGAARPEPPPAALHCLPGKLQGGDGAPVRCITYE